MASNAAGDQGQKGSNGKGKEDEGKADGPGVSRMRKEVVVLRKDTFVVDNDFFLVPVKIADHEVLQFIGSEVPFAGGHCLT